MVIAVTSEIVFYHTIHYFGWIISLGCRLDEIFNFTQQTFITLFHNLKVNLGCMSETALSGVPWCLNRLSKKAFATSAAVSKTMDGDKKTLRDDLPTYVVILS